MKSETLRCHRPAGTAGSGEGVGSLRSEVGKSRVLPLSHPSVWDVKQEGTSAEAVPNNFRADGITRKSPGKAQGAPSSTLINK